jgi:hypothetical protein
MSDVVSNVVAALTGFLGFDRTPALDASLTSGVLVCEPAAVNVSKEASPNGTALSQPYDKVNFVFGTKTVGEGKDAKEVKTLEMEAFVEGALALYGDFASAAQDLIYAHDLGVKSTIRQNLVRDAEGPDKALIAAAKRMLTLPKYKGKTLDELVAKLREMEA